MIHKENLLLKSWQCVMPALLGYIQWNIKKIMVKYQSLEWCSITIGSDSAVIYNLSYAIKKKICKASIQLGRKTYPGNLKEDRLKFWW